MEKYRDFWVRGALVLALLLPVYFLAAALGTKFHVVPWTIGFGQMTFVWGPRLLLGVALLALIGTLLALFVQPRRGVGAALVALLIPLLALGYAFTVRQQAMSIPPIHDISTDLVDPPGFSSAVAQARVDIPHSNNLDLLSKRTGAGRAFVDLQRESYADIIPLSTPLAPARAFEVALALAREQKWRIGRVDATAGSIEATAETFWYGFVDDIVIRVRADGAGSRVDMRSVSRVGGSDIGANAARMRPFLAELRARLSRAESEPGPAPAAP